MQPEPEKTAPTDRVGTPLGILLAVLAGAYRILPHASNLTPIGALGLYAGARLRSRYALLVPLLVMVVSDALLHWQKDYPLFTRITPFVYGSFLVNVLLGRLLRHTDDPLRIGGASLLTSLQFFLVTNFAVWLFGDGTLYPHTPGGLVQCYVLGLPFFGNTLVGDLLFSGVFFGLHAAVAHRSPVLAERHAS